MTATPALREALNKGISSGNLADTKIILFSHRDSSGRVCRPMALYASSHVLGTVPYFNALLFGNFAESQLRDFGETTNEKESTQDYGYESDSDLEDDEDEKFLPRCAAKSSTRPFEIFENNKVLCEGHDGRIKNGKVVKIPDMAFVTFQAFVMYLYTGTIEFAPFGSKDNRRLRSGEIVNPSEDKVTRPSPKSIYRLADKALALGCICAGLAGCDIVEESFSRFASQYGEIRSLYVDRLARIWVRAGTNTILRGIEEKIESFVEGDLEHAAETVSALWEVLVRDGDVRPPSSNVTSVTKVKSPACWNTVKIALISSIRTGVFFDRKYWARHSHTSDMLKPVYFSSTVIKDKAQEMNNLVKYLIGPSTLVIYPEGSTESDYEGGLLENDQETLEVVAGKEEEIRAVLIAGSFSTWKSLFFYLCTDEILFAPLDSQGVDRLKYIRENTVAVTPAPCSPKGTYLLATLLMIQPLCNRSLGDIKSKVHGSAILFEVDRWVDYTSDEIMHLERFIPSPKHPKMISLMDENIRYISNGSPSNLVGLLKFGLKKAVEDKRRSRSWGY